MEDFAGGIRVLGKTGLEVSRLGFGSGQSASGDLTDSEVGRLLNGVLDSGIRVLDTGRCYGTSEDLIGKHLSHRRDEYVLVTKCCNHYLPPPRPDWSADLVNRSIEDSLKCLRMDNVDVLLLHGCPEKELHNDDMLDALMKCKKRGLTRFIGFSGDNEAAITAVDLGLLDCLEMSVSICDQQPIDRVLPKAKVAEMGVLSKRTIAGACWRDLSNYSKSSFDFAKYMQPYAERLAAMGFTPESLGFDGDWAELALRFMLMQEAVHVSLVGGRSLEHVQENIRTAQKEPLPESIYQAIRDAWCRHDDGSWKGQG